MSKPWRSMSQRDSAGDAAPSASELRLAIVVTCMGRLAFVRQTAPVLIADPRVTYCLVDYSCPEGSGDWLEAEYSRLSARVFVERVPGQVYFNKCKAMNAGARRARSEGAEYLAFLDADTLVQPGFLDFVLTTLDPLRFQIAGRDAAGNDGANLIGVVVLSSAQFDATGGFDEAFVHWGCEDLEYRLRLNVLHGLDYREIPFRLLTSLPHGHDVRFRFSINRDPDSCMQAGWAIIRRKLEHDWAGRMKRRFEDAQRLCTVQAGRSLSPSGHHARSAMEAHPSSAATVVRRKW